MRRGTRHRRRALTASACAAITAVALTCCSLVTSTDGLSGGPGSATDGATTDGMASDAAPIEAATSDGRSDADARTTGCLPTDVFCADFDEGPVEKGWDGAPTAIGTFATDTASFVSSPRAALVTLPVTAGYTQATKLTKTILGGYASTRCSFSLKRDALGTAKVTFATLEMKSDNGDLATVFVSAGPSEGLFAVRHYIASGDRTVSQDVPAALAFAPSEWHSLTLEVDRTKGKLFVDGAMIAGFDHGDTATPIHAVLRVGGLEMDSKNDAPWKLRFDDIHCERTP